MFGLRGMSIAEALRGHAKWNRENVPSLSRELGIGGRSGLSLSGNAIDTVLGDQPSRQTQASGRGGEIGQRLMAEDPSQLQLQAEPGMQSSSISTSAETGQLNTVPTPQYRGAPKNPFAARAAQMGFSDYKPSIKAQQAQAQALRGNNYG